MTRIASETLALQIAVTLLDDSERYHRGEIDYDEHTRRNRQSWYRAEQAGDATVRRVTAVINRRIEQRVA